MPGPLVVIRGGGDLATGVAARLHRSGFRVAVLEIEQPLAVRRLVALAEAVYAGAVRIEEFEGRRAGSAEAVETILAGSSIPVLVDPTGESIPRLAPAAVVDGRMRKAASELGRSPGLFLVGLGPGFTAGEDCDAVVETRRGHDLGRVVWNGSAHPDTQMPEPVAGFSVDRVLRAPRTGTMHGLASIGGLVRRGDPVFDIDGETLTAPFDGALRGLLHDGVQVDAGFKVGDLDPRRDPRYCRQISDKALAVGGGVLEALLSQPAIRRRLSP